MLSSGNLWSSYPNKPEEKKNIKRHDDATTETLKEEKRQKRVYKKT